MGTSLVLYCTRPHRHAAVLLLDMEHEQLRHLTHPIDPRTYLAPCVTDRVFVRCNSSQLRWLLRDKPHSCFIFRFVLNREHARLIAVRVWGVAVAVGTASSARLSRAES